MAAEFSVAPQWTVDVSGTAVLFSPWKNVGDGLLYLNGWDAVAEARYYLCKAFNGHHFGGFLEAARFGDASAHIKGLGNGADLRNVKAGLVGVSYGYYFKLNTYWGIDCTAGLGLGAGKYNGAQLEILGSAPRTGCFQLQILSNKRLTQELYNNKVSALSGGHLVFLHTPLGQTAGQNRS